MPTAALANAEIYYEITGEGQPLALIAGISIDHRFFAAQVRGLSKHFKVIAFDNRDVGLTKCSALDYNIDDMADDLNQLLDFLTVKNAHILGFSMGGFIAQSFATRYPDKVQSLILAGTSHNVSQHTRRIVINWLQLAQTVPKEMAIKEILLWTYGSKFFENEKNWRTVMNHLLTMENAQTIEQFGRQANAQRPSEHVIDPRTIKAPTLVLVGSEERVFTVKEARQLAEMIPGAELQIFEGLGHNLFVEDPKAVNMAIQIFCSKHGAGKVSTG
jgi:pimeloyl-ACP methyl ester carboxylesterase